MSSDQARGEVDYRIRDRSTGGPTVSAGQVALYVAVLVATLFGIWMATWISGRVGSTDKRIQMLESRAVELERLEQSVKGIEEQVGRQKEVLRAMESRISGIEKGMRPGGEP
jgi:hypothetical protein